MGHTKLINLQVSSRKVAIVLVQGGSDAQDNESLRIYTIIDILNLFVVAAIKNFRFLSSVWYVMNHRN